MQAERATGTLTVEDASESASLYFLFGHLFHAAGPQGQGEDIVIEALSWNDGNFKFDPRAKLPAEETIKSSPAELIAEAAGRKATAGDGGAVPAGNSAWASSGVFGAESGSATPADDQVLGAVTPAPEETASFASASWATPQHGVETDPEKSDAQQIGSAGTDAGSSSGPSEPVADTSPSPWGSPPAEAAAADTTSSWSTPASEPVPAYAANPATGREASTPTAAASSNPVPQEQPTAGSVLGAPEAKPLDILYPLPSGRAQYEGLKAAFVDFPKLLRSLRNDRHTGYVRLTASDFSGVLLFREGNVLQTLTSVANAQAGETAFAELRRRMDSGEGTLAVIELSADTVQSLAQLLAAPLMYAGLLGHFINFERLLEHLQEAGVEGAVVVVGKEDVGIILLRAGAVVGAYTEANGTPKTATIDVGKIAAEKAAQIEVKHGAGEIQPIDIESALERRY